jgi:UDP-N-acetylmuramyl pentapeptide phosphotransferase/UDP-N-acetylglucosamine-1-phosphate transferase
MKLVVNTLWMGTIGFIDDYIKIFKKINTKKVNLKLLAVI